MIDEDAAAVALEKIRGYVVLAITVGARVAEEAAAKRRDALRKAESVSRDAAHWVRRQHESEAAITRHDLRETLNPDWWERATPAEIGATYAVGRSFGELDPELAELTRHMAEEIETRYGIDPEPLAREADVKQAVHTAAAIVTEADRFEGRWDDPARHESLEARLGRFMPNEPDAQHARVSADVMQGEPVAAATTRTAGKARIIKPARTSGKTMER